MEILLNRNDLIFGYNGLEIKYIGTRHFPLVQDIVNRAHSIKFVDNNQNILILKDKKLRAGQIIISKRSIVQLLQVMIANQNLFLNGMCNWINTLQKDNIISRDERNMLFKYIQNNKPFFYRLTRNEYYYWKPKKIKPRLRWIRKHIHKNLLSFSFQNNLYE